MIFNGRQFVPNFAQGLFPMGGMPMIPPMLAGLQAPQIDPLRGPGPHVSLHIPRMRPANDDYRSNSPRGFGATKMEGGNAGNYMTPASALRQGRHGSVMDPVARAMAQMTASQLPHQFFHPQLAGY